MKSVQEVVELFDDFMKSNVDAGILQSYSIENVEYNPTLETARVHANVVVTQPLDHIIVNISVD